MNILNTLDTEINLIKTKELPENLINITSLDSKIKILTNQFVNKHPNLFAQFLGSGQVGGTYDKSHDMSKIMKVYSNLDTGNINENISTTHSMLEHLRNEIRNKKNLLNQDGVLLDTTEKVINVTTTMRDIIEKTKNYNIFNFKNEDIRDLISDDKLDKVESYANYLMNSDNFFMINKLHAIQYILNYPILNINVDKIQIDKSKIDIVDFYKYTEAYCEYNKLMNRLLRHVRNVVSLNKSDDKKSLHKLINKQLLQKYNLLATKIRNDTPSIYVKIQIIIDTIINLTESLLNIIGNNTLDIGKINNIHSHNNMSLNYGVNLINCLESITQSLVS